MINENVCPGVEVSEFMRANQISDGAGVVGGERFCLAVVAAWFGGGCGQAKPLVLLIYFTGDF